MLDLPGTYSLSPQSPDEQICRDVLLQRLAEVPAPAMVIVVVDASNLERNLYFASQVIELGWPVIIALNMVDVAEQNGQIVDCGGLGEALAVPVVATVASSGGGVAEIEGDDCGGRARARRTGAFRHPPAQSRLSRSSLPAKMAVGSGGGGASCRALRQRPASARAEALLIVSDEKFLAGGGGALSGGGCGGGGGGPGSD